MTTSTCPVLVQIQLWLKWLTLELAFTDWPTVPGRKVFPSRNDCVTLFGRQGFETQGCTNMYCSKTLTWNIWIKTVILTVAAALILPPCYLLFSASCSAAAASTNGLQKSVGWWWPHTHTHARTHTHTPNTQQTDVPISQSGAVKPFNS